VGCLEYKFEPFFHEKFILVWRFWISFHAFYDIMQIASSGTHEPLVQSFVSRARKGAIMFATSAFNNRPLQLNVGISKHMANMVSWKNNVFSFFPYKWDLKKPFV
jgi:hypothetical protein